MIVNRQGIEHREVKCLSLTLNPHQQPSEKTFQTVPRNIEITIVPTDNPISR